jgi:hypothetical protein
MEDTLFTKESLKEAISTIGDASFTLIYDANELESQLSAGRELQQAEWILATIADHVYDYYPVSYFMNEDGKKEYPEFREWFLSHTEVGVKNAIRFVSNNFSVLETVTRDEYNQHRIPRRDLDKENHVKAVLEEVARNINYFTAKLTGPKKTTDPGKPSEAEIKNLIKAISDIQQKYSDFADQRADNDFTLQVFQFNKMLDMYKNPLLMAWQVYNYGWHSDFWEEGDTMFDYMMFSVNAEEIIKELIKTLENQSPFAQMERFSAITNGLLHVYRHVLTQDLSKI